MKPSKYSSHFPQRTMVGTVNTSLSLHCWIGYPFLVFCRSDWVRLLDSCAGTDLDLCCQDREAFFFNPTAPRALLLAYQQPLPHRAPETKHTSGSNSSLCTGLAGPARFLCYWQGQRLRSVFVMRNAGRLSPIWSNLKSPKSIQNWLYCPVVVWVRLNTHRLR